MYGTERRLGAFSLALAIAGGLLIGGIVLSVALWVLGMLAGIVLFVIKLAVLVGLAAAVVWAARFFFSDHGAYNR